MGSLRSALAFFVLAAASAHLAQAQPAPPPPTPIHAPTPPAPAAPPTPVNTPPSTTDHTPNPVPVPSPAPAPASPAPASPAPSPPAPSPPDPRRRDPHTDRVLLLPTAETQPRGSITLSTYDLVLYQLGYAITDSLQLTLSATPPIEGFFPFDFSLKSSLARGDSFRLAAIGSASGVLGLDDGPAFLGRLGLVGQACLDASCRSSANLALSALLIGSATLVGTGGGVVLGVSDSLALLGEVDTLVPTGRATAEAHGIAGGAGVRWRGKRWALDASLFSALDRQGVLPLLVGSYRFLPD